MRRVVSVLVPGITAVAAVIWFLGHAAPDGINAPTLVLLRTLDAEGFAFSSARFLTDGSLVVSGAIAGEDYADEEHSLRAARRALRSLAALYIDHLLPFYPDTACACLMPGDDILLTEDVPRSRSFRRPFFDLLVEETLARRVPGATVIGKEGGVLALDSNGRLSGEVIDALIDSFEDPLFGGVELFEVSGRRLGKADLLLLSAAARSGYEPEDITLSVQETDIGPVVGFLSPPGEVPEVLPAPLSIDEPEALGILALEEALLDGFVAAKGREPAGLFVAIAGEAQFQHTEDLRLRIAERKDAVLWGDRRFKVKTQHSANWKYIIIHHTATDSATFHSIDRYHREIKGWKHGTGYHFIIGKESMFV